MTHDADGGWTLATLKEHYDQRFLETDKAVHTAMISYEKAVSAALLTVEKATEVLRATTGEWQRNANEWRDAMDDREKTFATNAQTDREFRALREKLESELDRIRDSLEELRLRQAETATATLTRDDGSKKFGTYLIAGVTILVATVAAATSVLVAVN